MKIYTETSIHNFEFWSGAKQTVSLLTEEELEQIEAIIEEEYPNGMSETELNDYLWFNTDFIAEVLGYADFETLYTERARQ